VIPGGSNSNTSTSSPAQPTPPPAPIPPEPSVNKPIENPPKEIPKETSSEVKKPPLKNISAILPLPERIARENAMKIKFVLPKKLLDTGARTVTESVKAKITSRVKILAQK
jgi:hypothetical protein